MSHRNNHHRGRGRGRGQGFRGRGKFHKSDDRNGENDSPWQKKVKENWDSNINLDFTDYEGEKKHELPEDFLALLNEEKTKAEDKRFLLEPDFGITEYVNKDVAGFTGILKHRYSDFVVHEIDKNGTVVKLTSLDLPAIKSRDEPKDYLAHGQLPEETRALISPLSWTRLTQLSKKCDSNEDKNKMDNAEVKIEVTSKSKEERKAYHEAIKKYFPHLDTKTIDEGDKKIVLICPQKSGANVIAEKSWPRDRPKNLIFHMCKEEVDSMAVFGQLCRQLHIHNSKFRVAGNKDRRAITTQKVAVSWVTAEKLKSAVKSLWAKVFVGNFSYEKESLELGDLKGNRFTIALRNIKDPNDAIEKAMESWKENGFINYFGQQRFGTEASVKTSDIGLALIQSDWLKAIELILKPRGNESPQMTRMRTHWWMYRNPADAVVLLGSRIAQSKSIEATLLQGLAQVHGNDYVSALDILQKNSKLLYVHAYQALIWNKVVSQRVAKFGLKVLVGDWVKTGDVVTDSEGGNEDMSKRELFEAQLTEVTEENIDKYAIEDVVMPIPGYKVKYPNNAELKQMYLDLLAADGLVNGFESLKHKVDMYSLPGDYRAIVNKPQDLTWQFVKYNDMNEDLLASDVAILRGGEQVKSSAKEGKFEALIVEFSLPSSTYATMALREAMKIDMGKGAQSALTDEYKAANEDKKRELEGPTDESPTKKAKTDNNDEVN